MSEKGILGVIAVLLAVVAALIATTLPEIQRYLRIRSM
jgi:hypothetical protein